MSDWEARAEAEQAIPDCYLAAVQMAFQSEDRWQEIAAVLRPYDFPDVLASVWGGICHRREAGLPVTKRGLADWLRAKHALDDETLFRFVDFVADPFGVEWRPDQVVRECLETSLDRHLKERLAKLSNGAATSATERLAKVSELTTKAEARREEYQRVFGSGHLSLKVSWLDEIALDFARAELVAGLLDQGAMSVCYGASNSGKTFWAVTLACHVAAGLPFGDAAVAQGPVLYIAAESSQSAVMRAKAWQQWHRIERLPLAVVQSQVDLHAPGGSIGPLMRDIQQLTKTAGAPVLVIVDTLARAMGSGDENQAVDMGLFVQHCDRIRVETGAHVMLVHHAGKDEAKGARGSSALRAATDTELQVSEFVLSVTKQRDREGGTALEAKRAVVEMADPAGLTRSTLALYGIEPRTPVRTPDQGEGAKLRNQDIAVRVLDLALETMGRKLPATRDHGPAFAVRIDEAAELAPRFYPHEDPEVCKRTFRRNLEQLGKRGAVTIEKPNVWMGKN